MDGLFLKATTAAIAVATVLAISSPAFAIKAYQSRGVSSYHSRGVGSYQSRSIAPRSSATVRQYNSRGIQQHQSRSVHVLARAERNRMIQNDRKAGRALANQWTRGTGRLNQSQIDAIRQIPVR